MGAPGFVQATGTRFTLDGRVFPAIGVNCYFLGYCSDESRLAVFTAARQLQATVIRAWAFLDRPAANPGEVAFQYAQDGAIVVNKGADGLERLDALLAAAEEFEIRLILPLVNYWDDFGGMSQYLSWLGLAGSRDVFYRDERARGAYRQWVETLLTRQNTRTGRRYSDEPSVLAWQLANEPRCGSGPGLLLDWIGEMSRFVKSIAPDQLLGAGEEGYFRRRWRRDALYNGGYGVDSEAILNLPGIDFGTYHFYPDAMGHGPEFAERWIEDHAAAGERAGKPVLFAEFGLESGAARDGWYRRWEEWVDAAGGSGRLLWMLGGKGQDVMGFRDRYTI